MFALYILWLLACAVWFFTLGNISAGWDNFIKARKKTLYWGNYTFGETVTYIWVALYLPFYGYGVAWIHNRGNIESEIVEKILFVILTAILVAAFAVGHIIGEWYDNLKP